MPLKDQQQQAQESFYNGCNKKHYFFSWNFALRQGNANYGPTFIRRFYFGNKVTQPVNVNIFLKPFNGLVIEITILNNRLNNYDLTTNLVFSILIFTLFKPFCLTAGRDRETMDFRQAQTPFSFSIGHIFQYSTCWSRYWVLFRFRFG